MISRMQTSRLAPCPVGFDKRTRHRNNACLVCSLLEGSFYLALCIQESVICILHQFSWLFLHPSIIWVTFCCVGNTMCVCMCVCRGHLYPSPHTCGGQRAALWSSFSPSTFTRVLRIGITQLVRQASVCAELVRQASVCTELVHQASVSLSCLTGPDVAFLLIAVLILHRKFLQLIFT